MFTSFSTALSGLNAMTDAIDVVGNNLANLNTTGYKANSLHFSELISQALGGSASTQVGLGTARPDTVRGLTQGAVQSTGGQYDAAIQGDGFFIVKGGDGQQLYTRDGSFKVDSDGFLTSQGGEKVQGWSANTSGVVNTNSVIGNIQVPVGSTLQPRATTAFSLSANLNSSATPLVPMTATGSNSGAVNITTNTNDKVSLKINGAAAQNFTLNANDTTMAAVAADLQSQFTNAGIAASATVNSSGNLQIASTAPGASAGVQVMSGTANSALGLSVTQVNSNSDNTFATQAIQAVDSLGNTVPLTLSFTKATTNGTWNYSISSAAGAVSGGTGSVQFDNSGKMTGINSATISADGKSDVISISNLPDGAANLTMNWDFFDADGTPKFTQFSGSSATSANAQNGQAAAELTGVSIGDNGQVLAKYSDGTQEIAAQLAMANIRNPDSLLGGADNTLSLGAGSASPSIGVAGTGGRGTIEGGALEGSTVDIASQFSNLLVYQRSYQANSRVITVSDDISQETVNLIK
jgi:flagellar hook protein FlgE